MNRYRTGCMVCEEELVYENQEKKLSCIYCKKVFSTSVSCKNNHYICDSCHASDSIDLIFTYCLNTDEKNPLEIANKLMKSEKVNMHGPEHHFLVPAVLMTSFLNTRGDSFLKKDKLTLIRDRAVRVPGGICGTYGSCGAAVGTGIFISVLTEATPLTEKSWGLSNETTGRALIAIGKLRGPRCCKRNTFTAIIETVRFVKENLETELEVYDSLNHIKCEFKSLNRQCIGKRCPFS